MSFPVPNFQYKMQQAGAIEIESENPKKYWCFSVLKWINLYVSVTKTMKGNVNKNGSKKEIKTTNGFDKSIQIARHLSSGMYIIK